MDFPCLKDMISKSNWSFNQPNNTDEQNGWRKLCSTDCNGTIQNIGNPNKTCGCYLKNYSSNHHPDGKRINKGQNKKSKEYPPINPSSVFENILIKANDTRLNTGFERTNTGFERTNTLFSKENIFKEKNNKLVNSEVSYFSDKSFYDFCSSKVVENGTEDPKKFTLFPEKSNSSPSILDGLSSYFKKNTPPRSRSLSDPQSNQQIPTPEKLKDDSPDSGFNSSPGFVESRISSLRSKIDEFESEFRIKDETIDENTKLPSIFNYKHCHGANEQTSIQEEKTIGESFTPLYGLIPKRLFDCYSFQNQKVITPTENTYIYRRKENYLCQQKANQPNSLDVGMNKPKMVVPLDVGMKKPKMVVPLDVGMNKPKMVVPLKNSSEFYPFQPNMYHSLNYPPMNRQPLYCNVDSTGLSREWLNFLKKFQSLSTGNKSKVYRTDNNDSETKGQGKKNFRKANYNQQQPAMECKFCKSNMESPKMYKSHHLKQKVGRRTLVTCPVLRKLVCERCGETGDNAHTLSYCPLVIAESGKKPVSVAAELKKTRRVASGRMRKPF